MASTGRPRVSVRTCQLGRLGLGGRDRISGRRDKISKSG